MSVITFDDKVALKADSSIERVNKVTDNDLNEIKNSVNALYDGSGGIMLVAKRLLTAAEILDLRNTPIVMAAAPGANIAIKPIMWNYKLTFVSAYSSSSRFELSLGSTELINDTSTLDNTVTTYTGQDITTALGNTWVNEDLRITSVNGVEPAGGLSTLFINVLYQLLDFN